jgi:hypothetical protein
MKRGRGLRGYAPAIVDAGADRVSEVYPERAPAALSARGYSPAPYTCSTATTPLTAFSAPAITPVTA